MFDLLFVFVNLHFQYSIAFTPPTPSPTISLTQPTSTPHCPPRLLLSYSTHTLRDLKPLGHYQTVPTSAQLASSTPMPQGVGTQSPTSAVPAINAPKVLNHSTVAPEVCRGFHFVLCLIRALASLSLLTTALTAISFLGIGISVIGIGSDLNVEIVVAGGLNICIALFTTILFIYPVAGLGVFGKYTTFLGLVCFGANSFAITYISMDMSILPTVILQQRSSVVFTVCVMVWVFSVVTQSVMFTFIYTCGSFFAPPELFSDLEKGAIIEPPGNCRQEDTSNYLNHRGRRNRSRRECIFINPHGHQRLQSSSTLSDFPRRHSIATCGVGELQLVSQFHFRTTSTSFRNEGIIRGVRTRSISRQDSRDSGRRSHSTPGNCMHESPGVVDSLTESIRSLHSSLADGIYQQPLPEVTYYMTTSIQGPARDRSSAVTISDGKAYTITATSGNELRLDQLATVGVASFGSNLDTVFTNTGSRYTPSDQQSVSMEAETVMGWDPLDTASITACCSNRTSCATFYPAPGQLNMHPETTFEMAMRPIRRSAFQQYGPHPLREGAYDQHAQPGPVGGTENSELVPPNPIKRHQPPRCVQPRAIEGVEYIMNPNFKFGNAHKVESL